MTSTCTNLVSPNLSDAAIFSIDANSTIMDILSTKIYVNKELAFIREIMCNAYDAHVERKCENIPIKVTINHDSILIQDYGFGLHHDDIIGLYTTYGSSSKKGDNQFTGSMGIGCKSPLAYTDSFSVCSIFDGIKSTYYIFKDAKNYPRCQLISQVESTEETGLTVNIPIDYNFLYGEQYIKHVGYFFEVEPIFYIGDVLTQIGNYKNDTVEIHSDSFIRFSKLEKTNLCLNSNVITFKFKNVIYDLTVKHGKTDLSVLFGEKYNKIFNYYDRDSLEYYLIEVLDDKECQFNPGRELLEITDNCYNNIVNFIDNYFKNYLNELLNTDIQDETFFNSNKVILRLLTYLLKSNNGIGNAPPLLHDIFLPIDLKHEDFTLLTSDEIEALEKESKSRYKLVYNKNIATSNIYMNFHDIYKCKFSNMNLIDYVHSVMRAKVWSDIRCTNNNNVYSNNCNQETNNRIVICFYKPGTRGTFILGSAKRYHTLKLKLEEDWKLDSTLLFYAFPEANEELVKTLFTDKVVEDLKFIGIDVHQYHISNEIYWQDFKNPPKISTKTPNPRVKKEKTNYPGSFIFDKDLNVISDNIVYFRKTRHNPEFVVKKDNIIFFNGLKPENVRYSGFKYFELLNKLSENFNPKFENFINPIFKNANFVFLNLAEESKDSVINLIKTNNPDCNYHEFSPNHDLTITFPECLTSKKLFNIESPLAEDVDDYNLIIIYLYIYYRLDIEDIFKFLSESKYKDFYKNLCDKYEYIKSDNATEEDLINFSKIYDRVTEYYDFYSNKNSKINARSICDSINAMKNHEKLMDKLIIPL